MFLEFLERIKIPPAPFSRGSSGLRPQKKLENLSWDLLIGEHTGMKVDLVMKTALEPGIGERILEEVVYI